MTRILVVDDDPAVRRVVTRTLETTDRSVVWAGTAEAALDAAAANKPDLIVLDALLPGMTGFELCRRLRAAHETWDVPVLMLTGLAAVADEVLGLQLGADDYVVKPFRTEDLSARVAALLRRARRRERPS